MFPYRVQAVAKANGRLMAASGRWLVGSREHTNLTYNLTARNLGHLAWWVALVMKRPVDEVRGYMAELDGDAVLREHIRAASAHQAFADQEARYGRRTGWYAIVRAARPQYVVETGTDKGLGTCVLAAALLRNGTGRLTTIDLAPGSGYLIGGQYAEVTNRVVGDSLDVLPGIAPIDLLLHDSLHTYEHEAAEYAVAPLAPRALVLSDNAHGSDALMQWAEQTGRQFAFFAEEPDRHWYPGAGIGAAWQAG
jgi:predicted O-methyltransferase YrrM